MISSGNTDPDSLAKQLSQSMNGEQKKMLSDALSDEETLKRLLSTPEAAALAQILAEIRGGE